MHMRNAPTYDMAWMTWHT